MVKSISDRGKSLTLFGAAGKTVDRRMAEYEYDSEQASSYPLGLYIAVYYGGNRSEFAKANGVVRQQVTKWLNNGFYVVDHKLYSPRRNLNRP